MFILHPTVHNEVKSVLPALNRISESGLRLYFAEHECAPKTVFLLLLLKRTTYYGHAMRSAPLRCTTDETHLNAINSHLGVSLTLAHINIYYTMKYKLLYFYQLTSSTINCCQENKVIIFEESFSFQTISEIVSSRQYRVDF